MSRVEREMQGDVATSFKIKRSVFYLFGANIVKRRQREVTGRRARMQVGGRHCVWAFSNGRALSAHCAGCPASGRGSDCGKSQPRR